MHRIRPFVYRHVLPAALPLGGLLLAAIGLAAGRADIAAAGAGLLYVRLIGAGLLSR